MAADEDIPAGKYIMELGTPLRDKAKYEAYKAYTPLPEWESSLVFKGKRLYYNSNTCGLLEDYGPGQYVRNCPPSRANVQSILMEDANGEPRITYWSTRPIEEGETLKYCWYNPTPESFQTFGDLFQEWTPKEREAIYKKREKEIRRNRERMEAEEERSQSSSTHRGYFGTST